MQLPLDFKEFLKLLNSRQVKYLLIGGYAVSYYGYPRATGDMDVWIAINPQNAAKVVEVLKEFGFDVANLSVDLGNAAVTRDVTELRAIELAQKKMLTGSYGECVTCGYAIPFERLMAVLSAERCAPCQEKFERTHMDGMRGASM
jgi:hypothetical protein